MFKGLFDFNSQSFKINWVIIAPIFIFIFFSLLGLSSTSDLQNINSTFYKQCFWLIIGVILFVLMQYIRMQYIYDYSYIFYFIIIILLIATLFGPKIEGSRRWIPIGPFSFQPSEFCKILYIASVARFISDSKFKESFSMYLFVILLLSILPPILIIKQPDLGTAIAYLSIILPLLFWSKIKTYIIFFLISPLFSVFATYKLWIFYLWMFLLILMIIIYRPKLYIAISNFVINILCAISAPYIWNSILHPHQRARVRTFLDPLSDPLGSGYQLIQSIISIGSGGLLGKGLGQGTQTHLKFLPVRDTDFILSVLAEELGYVSILVIIIAINFFIYWCFVYANKIENKYISAVIIGFSTIIYMHMVINLAMISGILPVTGLPAPFISYGGSFFLTCSIIIGLINNSINNYL